MPVYEFPERAARALGKAAEYATWRTAAPGTFVPFDETRMQQARHLCREIGQARGDTWLTDDELHQLAALIQSLIAHRDDAAIRPRVRHADLQHLALDACGPKRRRQTLGFFDGQRADEHGPS